MSIRNSVAATLLPGFVGTVLPEWVADRLRDGMGGVCVFGPNIVSHSQLRELTDAIYAANPKAIIAIDEEGGDATRLYYETGSPYPGNAVLGRINDVAYTEAVARSVPMRAPLEFEKQSQIRLGEHVESESAGRPINDTSGPLAFGRGRLKLIAENLTP